MRTVHNVRVIESIRDFLDDPKLSEEFYTQQAESSCDFINNPDRAARCHDAASEGADGSTHQEAIDDFREFGSCLLRDAWNAIDNQLAADPRWDTNPSEMEAAYAYAETSFEACSTSFQKDCDTLEQWHHANGSLHRQIG